MRRTVVVEFALAPPPRASVTDSVCLKEVVVQTAAETVLPNEVDDVLDDTKLAHPLTPHLKLTL